MQKILLIQTAFIGDVILGTAVIEKIHQHHPEANIDFLVRKGNEGLLEHHPLLNEVLVWDKQQQKKKNLLRMIKHIRQNRYDVVVNMQRFFATGLMTAFSRAPQRIGFDKNPLAFLFTKKVAYRYGDDIHEVDRVLSLIAHFTDNQRNRPKLYPSQAQFDKVAPYKQNTSYLCMAPTSVWFTKQFLQTRWIELLQTIEKRFTNPPQIYLLGAPGDKVACEQIIEQSNYPKIKNLAGELSLLESAALMRDAQMNYVNDSAPMHLASSMNAPVCTIYCSTTPYFGYGPLSENSTIVQVNDLDCRPCGLHGHKECPKGHFACANRIGIEELLACLPS
ncbi:heptosyltransferase [marine bacterium AO1-C]|nr:heptosyltransferase [marine bacterium AO1-C]